MEDHCHFTGKFRGAAHNTCNLQVRTIKKIPVFFHNLAGIYIFMSFLKNIFFILGYDSHIIFRNLHKIKINGTPSLIAKGMEKFISFQLEELAFKDSLQFLNSSLEKLVENLADKADSKDELELVFPHLKAYFDKHWSHLPKEAFEMLTRKGVYPYSYMDSFGNYTYM